MAEHEQRKSIWNSNKPKAYTPTVAPGGLMDEAALALDPPAPPVAPDATAFPIRPTQPIVPPRPNMTVNEVKRHTKQKAASDYKSMVALVAPLLQAVEEDGLYSQGDLAKIANDLLVMFESSEGSTLIESMQIIRVDFNVNRGYHKYHTINVALLNAMIARLLNLGKEDFMRVVKLGLVMDFGMVRLPEALRRRDIKLQPEDIAVIRRHGEVTNEVLQKSGETDSVLMDAVLMHHERYDGRGYPLGLQGDEIALIARIAAISDTYDAAVSRKKYTQRKSPFDILAELISPDNTQLDAEITRVMVHGFAHMLVGTHISLSDNSVGVVLDVDMNNLSYPLVRVVNRRIQTGPELYPVALTGHLPLF